MTEELTYCVRGCRRKCREDECVAGAECGHDTRIRASVGYLCTRCSDQLLQAVNELPDLWAQMPGLYDTGQTDNGGIRHTRVSGSPALIRLDVMVLTGRQTAGQFAGDGVLPVWSTLDGWLQIIEEELGLTPQGHTMTEVCTLLRIWHKRLCSQLWVDEYWDDLAAIRLALRRSTGAPGPIGRCWGRIANRPDGGCGRLLYPPPPGKDSIVCPNDRCGRTYTGPELIKLAIQGEREGIA